MDKNERKEMAADIANSMLDEFSKSVKRVVSLFGSETEALNKVLLPELREVTGYNLPGVGCTPAIPTTYMGEKRDLRRLLAGSGWMDTLYKVEDFCVQGISGAIHPGDYLEIPLKVKAAKVSGVEYEALDLESTVLTVTHVFKNRVIFCFEDVLFSGPINEDDTNKGGFKESALAKYLNTTFLEPFSEIKDFLALNKDDLRITLPTRYEVFGEGEPEANWTDEPCQLEYFKRRKNRIKVDRDDDTMWYWLSTPYAAAASHFCNVSTDGNAGTRYASSGDGGCAPAFCVA
ncbi:hypothetical protein AGMMS4952_11070 [Spirochaetia bacterium]|nr:hypothetical protein AGMMS4952_11070 [Spirochaetia bacterium]